MIRLKLDKINTAGKSDRHVFKRKDLDEITAGLDGDLIEISLITNDIK